MEKNVGGYDRIARLVIGPVLIIAALAIYLELVAVTGLLGAALIAAGALIGAVLLVTGLTRMCVLNSLLGIDTFRGRVTEETTTDPEQGVGRTN
jgi:hypothetical protein